MVDSTTMSPTTTAMTQAKGPAPEVTDLEVVPCAVCDESRPVPAEVRVPRDDSARRLDLPGDRSQWVVCGSCGLVYQSPRPGPASVANLYTDGSYHTTRGGIPEHYVQYSLRRSVEALDWALEQVDGPGRALDIGCGVGGALVTLRDRGWDVTGVEPDDAMAAVARERFGLDARTGFFTGDSIDGEPFDLAYSCHVWEHLADPVATSRAAHSALVAAGGHLMIVVPTFRRPRTKASICFTAPHTYMFTEVSLGNLLGRAGFEVVQHRFHAGADSELWLLAQATGKPTSGPSALQPEHVDRVQSELRRARFGAPLGALGRLRTHAATLRRNPRDFAARTGRWCTGRIGLTPR